MTQNLLQPITPPVERSRKPPVRVKVCTRRRTRSGLQISRRCVCAEKLIGIGLADTNHLTSEHDVSAALLRLGCLGLAI